MAALLQSGQSPFTKTPTFGTGLNTFAQLPQTPKQTNPEAFKALILAKHPNGVAADGRKYADIPAQELTQKIVTKFPNGVTNDGRKYADFLQPSTPAPTKNPITGANPFGATSAQPVGYFNRVGAAFKASVDQANEASAFINDPNNNPNLLERIQAAGKMAAGAAGAITAPIAPLFQPVSDIIHAAGEGYATLPAVQKFAESPASDPVRGVAEFAANAGVVSGSLLMGAGALKAAPKLSAKMQSAPKATPEYSPKLVAKRTSELTKLENNNAAVRRVILKAKSQGIDSKKILAETDLLHGAVDKTGTLRTQEAIGELNAFIRPHEGVISKSLAREGKSMPLAEVEKYQISLLNKSRLEGAALENAFSKLEAEMNGLARRADSNGNILLAKIQDAKVSKYETLDYMNPASKAADKIIARGYKELVAKNTKSVEANALNRELQSHYSVLNLLEKLDGKKVDGGKLGRYFAQTVGAVVGSHFGPLGSIAGAEIAGRIKGASMASKFKGKSGMQMQTSPALKAATEAANQPRLALPAPQAGAPTKANYTPIPLRGKISDEPGYSKSVGARNQSQSPTNTAVPKANNISSTEAPKQGIVEKAKGIIETIKKEGNKGFIKNPFGKGPGKYPKEVAAFLKKDPPLDLLKDMKRFIDAVRLGKAPDTYINAVGKKDALKIYSADMRDALAEFGVNHTKFKNDARLADFAEEVILKAYENPAQQLRVQKGKPGGGQWTGTKSSSASTGKTTSTSKGQGGRESASLPKASTSGRFEGEAYYHGSNYDKNIRNFKQGDGELGKGIYFTKDKDSADLFATRGKTYEVRLPNIKPYEMSDFRADAAGQSAMLAQKIFDRGTVPPTLRTMSVKQLAERIQDTWKLEGSPRVWLEKAGFDGITDRASQIKDQIVIFDAKKIVIKDAADAFATKKK